MEQQTSINYKKKSKCSSHERNRKKTVMITFFISVFFLLAGSIPATITTENISFTINEQKTVLSSINNDFSTRHQTVTSLPGVNLKTNNVPDVPFYGYNMDDSSGQLVEGPVEFFPNDPGVILQIAPTISLKSITCSCWEGEADFWYGLANADSEGSLWIIDEISGIMTRIGGSGLNWNGLAYDDSTEMMYAATHNYLYKVQKSTGFVTGVGNFGISKTMISIASDGYGKLYGISVSQTTNDDLYIINTTTGAATLIGSLGVSLYGPQDIAFDKNSGVLYAAAFLDTRESGLYTINLTTGNMTKIGAFQGNARISALAIPYTFGPLPDHDVKLKRINAPYSGLGTVITPEIMVQNRGNNSENNVPINMKIANKVTTIWSEDFESPNALNGWTQTGSGTGQWLRTAYGSHSYEPPGTGDYYLDAFEQFGVSWNNSIFTPAIDLSSSDEILVVFERYFLQYLSYFGQAKVRVYSGGINQSNFEEEILWLDNNDPSGGVHTEIYADPTSYADKSNVYFEFWFTDDGADSKYSGFTIDDLQIIGISWVYEYDQTITVDIPFDTILNVSYPDWTPTAFQNAEDINIGYKVEVNISYIDNKTDNNYNFKYYTLHYGYIHDLGVNEILTPYSGQPDTFTPEIEIENYGQNDENNVDVNLKIEKIQPGSPFYRQVVYSGTGLWNKKLYGTYWCEPHGDGDYYAVARGAEYEDYDVGLFTYAFDFTGMTNVTVSFLRNFQGLGPGQAKVRTYSGGYNSSNWEQDLLNLIENDPPFEGTYTVLTFDPSSYVDPSKVYIEWWFTDNGYSSSAVEMGIGIDDITISTINYYEGFEVVFPPGTYQYIEEYNETLQVNIDFAEKQNLVFPDWTPDDLTFGDISYLVTSSIDLATDGKLSNNVLFTYATLTYFHDVGVVKITEPSGPPTIDDYWPPGTYPVSGIVKNFGTNTEGPFNVNSKIWLIDEGGNQTLFYEDNVTISSLSVLETTEVIFNDVIFEDSDEGNYRLDMQTELIGDEQYNNDKESLCFIIMIPDAVPPETTHEFDGIVGDNNWYVNELTIILIAEDYSKTQKYKGPPSGINITWYRIDEGDWTEYIGPFLVNEDGEHVLEYYSIDNNGNVEDIQGPFDFKIDQTLPIIINVTVEKVGFTLYKIIASVDDATSGVARVEFFRDDSLLGNVTEAPWEWEYTGSVGSHTVNIVVYDHAGNQIVSEDIESTVIYNYVALPQSITQLTFI